VPHASPLAGLWFDGRSSRARPVQVRFAPAPGGPSLVLAPAEGESISFPNRAVGWPETWSAGRAPPKLVVDLRDHGSLEVADAAGWQAALAAAGGKLPLAQRMQTRWPVFLGVAVLALAGLGAFYRWGTPWAATQLTRQVPLEWETRLAERFLHDLDSGMLRASKLPPARQAELRRQFETLAARMTPGLQRYAGYAPRLQLHFRNGMGANAFALPGGTVVLTDEMVEAADKLELPDDALVGVLAHEIGHVVHRHTTRIVVEQGVLNIGFGIAMGDVSSIVSFGGSLLTGLAYRRSHETEADCFGLALMRQAGLPTAPMADLLLGIESGAYKEKAGAKPAASAPAPAASGDSWDLLSSHPGTPQRARALKDGHAPACQ
jgi:Zn-dependent protease with chaperone function